MRFFGLSVAPEASFPVSLLAQLGANMARITPRPDRDISGYLRDLRANGVEPLLCLDRSALTEPLNSLAARYGPLCRFWAAINESDDRGAESSYAGPDELSSTLATLRELMPGAYLIAGGFSTGQPSYLDAVDLRPASAISVHPYGQRPNNADDWSWVPGNFGYAGDLMQSYRRFGLPLWVDEIGVGVEDVGRQSAYLRAMATELDAEGVEGMVWFCGQDWGGTHYGLLDQFGDRKPTFDTFADVARYLGTARPVPTPQPPPPEPPPVPDFNPNPDGFWIGSGLLDACRKRGLTALSGEDYFTPQVSVALVHDGAGPRLLYWSKTMARAYLGPYLEAA